MSVGSGPRYQILSHVFARCASVQKSVTQIIYLGPLPRRQHPQLARGPSDTPFVSPAAGSLAVSRARRQYPASTHGALTTPVVSTRCWLSGR